MQKAVLFEVFRVFSERHIKLPVIAQISMEKLDSMLLGTDISAVTTILSSFDVDVIGLNCSTGPAEMKSSIAYLSKHCKKHISCIPNAGIPETIDGKLQYPLSPEDFSRQLSEFITEFGVNIVGGCCGTSPEYIENLSKTVRKLSAKREAPAIIPQISSSYSAVDLNQNPKPLIIGEELNSTTVKGQFRNYIIENKTDDIVNLAKKLVDEGSHVLDVCVAVSGKNEAENMKMVVSNLNTKINVPLMLDSTDLNVIEEGLKLYPGKAIINSTNLENGEQHFINSLQIAKNYGSAIICLTIDEDGMALTSQKKLEVAKRMVDIAVNKVNLDISNMIFDPLTLPLGINQQDGINSAKETLLGLQLIKEKLPECFTILGVSNVSYGLEKNSRRILNSIFLYEALTRGLDIAIINFKRIIPIFKLQEEEIQITKNLIYSTTEHSKALTAYINYFKEHKVEDIEDTVAKNDFSKGLEYKLKQVVISGNTENIELLIIKALKYYEPLFIINEILLEAMNEVGTLFNSGKMPLPSVLDSAAIIKKSVSILKPFMKKEDTYNKASILLATVKGDIHDIGKNLVDIILSNNGYNVINLGIKQSADDIINNAIKHNVSAIGLSGLLIKSIEEMLYVIDKMNERHINIPLIVGGAALTRNYVESKMKTKAKFPVVYAHSALDGLNIMNEIQNGSLKSSYNEIKISKEEDIISSNTLEKSLIQSIPDNIPPLPFDGIKVIKDINVNDLFKLINIDQLFQLRWKLFSLSEYDYKEQITSKYLPKYEEIKELMISQNLIEPQFVYSYFKCNSDDNNLIIYDYYQEKMRFEFPRQRNKKRLCLTDYFVSQTDNIHDIIPIFVCTIGSKASNYTDELYKSGKYSDYLYFHGVSVELAEALAEYTNTYIKKELNLSKESGKRFSFGYASSPNLAEQEKVFDLLDVTKKIDVTLTANYQMMPEQSVSAMIVHHKDAEYFNVS